ncbi:MAG: hypothetical protein C5B52_08290 [Bacteroidetes bacterium]|nr:MAG: hypothetical protein C5B52_08290 [Bacteroidota bacterium]
MKTTNKTPYEIRLDLLQLAFDILQSKAHADAGSRALAANSAGNAQDVILTSSPSTEDVIREAEKLNIFVSKAAHS